MASYTAQQAEAALRPDLERYLKAVDDEVFDVVEEYYHPNGVLIHKDKEASYGKKAIVESIKKFAEGSGKAVATISNAKFEGVGDYLVVTADFSSVTEKIGTVNGKFVQIWKKEGGKLFVYHDEFEITA
ncbi:unnamed protein product [Caenorhabditis sp. 36 PRJEB53466]|nr:unnamed protein product [Caenorhabditis sp. 36 PRJEB53466]